MLAILWLIVWATVGEAFYDDYNWYTSDDGVSDQRAFDPQREVHENFTNILRSYADSYISTREREEELTMAKAKSRLRMLKVFAHTGNSKDFEAGKGQMLPLHEGAKFCTMGRHTKVDCNHCTCVAGQLYMCTGMICPKPPSKPKPVITCKEGKRRKIDSCNYCYCRNGHEICSTRDCRLQHDHLLIRSKYTCHEGARRKVDCNRCICRNGEEYCSKKKCTKKKPTTIKFRQHNKMPEGRCRDGQSLKIDCSVCKCTKNRWRCSDKNCGATKNSEKLLWAKCREGATRLVDACNTCYCHLGREYCEKKDCHEEEPLQYYRNLRYDKKQCVDGSYSKVDCNFCLCVNGTEMCTHRPCPSNNLDFLRRRKECDRWDVKYVKCNRCECLAGQWVCTQRLCYKMVTPYSATGEEGEANNNDYFYLEVCKPGQKRKFDDCNYCFCRGGQWFCQIQDCNEQVERPKLKPDMINAVLKKSDVTNLFKTLLEQKTSVVDNAFEQLETKHGDNDYPDTDYNIFKPPENIREAVEFPQTLETNVHNENTGLNPELINALIGVSVLSDENGLVVEQPSCEPGSQKKLDSCNKCHCHKGLWFCESKDCAPDLAHLPPYCRRGDKIVVNCVPCKCRKQGWKCYLKKKKTNCRRGDKEMPLAEPPQALRMTYTHHDDDPTRKCKIGERYRMDSCNYCYCNSHRERVCTHNECTNPQHGDDKFPLDIDDKQCKIGSRFRKGECNYCYCNYNHNLVCSNNHCTRKSRYELSDERDLLRFTPAPKICLPHERFRLDNCNWCYCTKNRTRICERNPCDKKQKPDTRWPPNSPRRGCYIGSRFSRGKCEYCYCTVWRKIECLLRYNCTDNSTMTTTTTRKPQKIYHTTQRTRPRNSFNYECEVGQIQRVDDCNFCRCTFNRKWQCSDNICPSNYDHLPTTFSEPECLEGEPVPAPDPCNMCICLNSHILCTDNPCTQRQAGSASKNPRCVEGHTVKMSDGCNHCVCQGGQEFCTSRACLSPMPTTFSEPECLEGEPVPAPDPCNMCICLNSHILCTDNPCTQRQAGSASKNPRCVEGHTVKMSDGCNHCVCQGGQEFCTSRACLSPNNFLPDPDCTDGYISMAEDRCNMCVCMKGKIVCSKNQVCYGRKQRDAISENLLSYIRTQNNKKHKMTQSTKQKCTPGKKYFPEDFDPNCPNECICDRNELLCTKRKCYNNWDKQTPFKWPLGRVEQKSRNAKQFLKQEYCVENQKLPSDDPCNSCMCLNARKVCTIFSCTDEKEGELGSDEALFNKNVQGSKGNKGNMEKKNNTFCEPFTFFSPDNNRFCRNCFCLHNGLALCLLNLCKYSKDIPHQNSPEELDEVCNPGETGYPTKCVTCTCSEHGKWICTREELALCQERDCDEKDEFHMGFFPYCAGCKCSVKEWFCSIQSETCRDFSNATCPLGTFIHNPRQHCSICLCGGYEEGSHNMCFTEAKCVRQVISQLKLKQ